MHFQISRFGARLSVDGEIILLEDQDRSRWDTKHIAKGLNFLNLSVSGEELSSYHLQAGISACHAVSSSAADTDWERILGYYDALLFIDSSPIIKLNRAVAFSMVHGFAAGLPQLELLKSDLSLSSYYLLPATVAEMNFRIGNFAAAKHSYEQALKLVAPEVERRFILKRIKDCGTGNAKLANNGQN
jgi:RNA polymerase sigma-70 factor (ECF subfamily)